ncbi:MAG: DUF1003 domain-containing protein [Pseudomonadota bacterium]
MSQNIETILAYYLREEQKISNWQRILEKLSGHAERPLYAGAVVLFLALWILGNLLVAKLGYQEFDPPPFGWLQGFIGLAGLLTTTVVLIKQGRMASLAEQRAHLDLQVNLLTEQKVTKIIDLLEELRRDLPMVKDRHDAEAEEFQHAADPELVLAALSVGREPDPPAGQAPAGPDGSQEKPVGG